MLLNLDADAKKLAERFDGLPLALATAGDYIYQTANSFDDYLQMYEESWKDLAKYSGNLMEYDDRTLYTTWNISLKQVATQDPEVVKLFQLMGYLGNANLWYELFRKGARCAPSWFCEITGNKVRFDKAMTTLRGYSLIEAMSNHYSLHTCVHDWILEYQIGKFDIALFRLAAHCIAQNVAWNSTPESWLINRRLNHHALRLEYCQHRENVNSVIVDVEDIYHLGRLSHMMGRPKEAEAMYMRVLDTHRR